ncbi:hypothetical protein PHJA_002951900, partial [Phtheirospermum japonicum]
LICVGTLDPCSGSDYAPCASLQFWSRARLGRCRFPVLYAYSEGIRRFQASSFRLVLRPSGMRRRADFEARVVSHCLPHKLVLGLLAHDVVRDVSDTEN